MIKIGPALIIPIKIPSGPGAFQFEKFYRIYIISFSVITSSYYKFIFSGSMLSPP